MPDAEPFLCGRRWQGRQARQRQSRQRCGILDCHLPVRELRHRMRGTADQHDLAARSVGCWSTV
jgi:hypothetical protein